MTSFSSGWIIWNSGSITNPNFIPKEIYPPALQIMQATETVYSTQQQCEAAINASGGPHNYSTANAAGGIGSGVIGPAASTAQGINAVGNFFNKLSEGNVWLRIGEFVLGAALLAVALGKLTGVDTGVINVAKKVVK
jgi:hypothetical protein